MRKLFGIFILSVACCMIAGADMLLFAKTETYQLMFFGGYAVSALLLVASRPALRPRQAVIFSGYDAVGRFRW